MYDIYKSLDSENLRFTLGKDGEKKLFVIGLNPSTANKEESDLTVSKVEHVAKKEGFDGFVMLNLYPLRSTNPDGLPHDKNLDHFKLNIQEIENIASTVDTPVFWASWGVNIDIRPYLLESFVALSNLIDKIGGKWVHYGSLTKDGHPKHPSRLSYDWTFSEFNTKKYITKIKLNA